MSTMCCGIDACDAHKNCTSHPGHRCCDMLRPCTIRLQCGVLMIHTHSVCLLTEHEKLILYNVVYPFTRKHLMALNDIDSQEPDAYVRALKRHNPHQYFKPIEKRQDITVRIPPRIAFQEIWEQRMLRYQLTTEKAVMREQIKMLQEKDQEIEELRRKLKIEISPYSNETQYGETQHDSTTGDQRVGGEGADSS